MEPSVPAGRCRSVSHCGAAFLRMFRSFPGQNGNGKIFSALLFRGAEAGRLPRPLNNGRLAISAAAASSCGGHLLGGEAVQGGIY